MTEHTFVMVVKRAEKIEEHEQDNTFRRIFTQASQGTTEDTDRLRLRIDFTNEPEGFRVDDTYEVTVRAIENQTTLDGDEDDGDDE